MRKADAMAAELEEMKLKEASECVCEGIVETLSYTRFSMEYWWRILMNNAIERLNREAAVRG